MRTIFKFISLLALVGLSGYFSLVVATLFSIGSLNGWITGSFSVLALLSLISASVLVLGNRINSKIWHIVVLWLIYLSPAIFIFSFGLIGEEIRLSNQLKEEKKEVSLLMNKFHQQALPQGGYPNLDFFSTFGYSAVCDGDRTNSSYPSYQVSQIYAIFTKGKRENIELAKNSVSCVSDKNGYAFSVKFSDGTIKCIDKTGYFGPATALNTGTVCIK